MGMQRIPIIRGAMTLAVPHCEETPPAIVNGFKLLAKALCGYTKRVVTARMQPNTAMRRMIPGTSSCQKSTAARRLPP